MSVQAYKSVAQRAESPREAEYRLFGEVTRSLIAAATLDPSDVQGRMAALDWNRRLWSALASDCLRDDNAAPVDLRAQIVTLSRWVSRHSSAVMRREEEFEPLISVNRSIMQGLAARP